jgi:hypothetical protein
MKVRLGGKMLFIPVVRRRGSHARFSAVRTSLPPTDVASVSGRREWSEAVPRGRDVERRTHP